MLRSVAKAGAAALPRRAVGIGRCSNGIFLPGCSVADAVPQAGPTRTFSQSVQDATVNVTFVDISGERLTVPGFVGQNLVDVAVKHEILLDGPCNGRGSPRQKRHSADWTENLYGQGPACNCCHVMIPNEYLAKLEPRFENETELLKALDDVYSPGSSRLGCQIRLTKELDGITVFIPDGPPLDGS